MPRKTKGTAVRQIDAIRLLAKDHATQDKVRAAVKLGVTAFTLEWDGHVQAMTGTERVLEWSFRSESAATESQVEIL